MQFVRVKDNFADVSMVPLDVSLNLLGVAMWCGIRDTTSDACTKVPVLFGNFVLYSLSECVIAMFTGRL